jgi:hypothetical protein
MASSASIETTDRGKYLPKVKSILEENTKGKGKETFYKTLAHTGIAVLGGGLVSAVIGKPSFALGLGLTGLSYYKDISWLAPLGIGMMATSHIIPNDNLKGVSGFDLKQETENAKNRLVSFKDALLSKTYLDKIIKPNTSTSTPASNRMVQEEEETTSGFGSVSENLNVLNQIEQQLVNSAKEQQNQRKEQSTQGFSDEMNGFNETDFSGF